ncbi:acyltransferase family protein [Gordonia alkanivorans]|uniref:acyltransferase family protein n=1 Tax=Gordonia alkanivorans TaxID=84096 RepID=UPI00244BA91A|nr:acyltransferase [Gordonia alkanivorans]MDH3012551.1 acyltransferase [Gordonia alkanivorans]
MRKVAPKGNHSRYAHIDAMRAFAVMIVVLAHGGLGAYLPGGSGVTIFFAISGFIITFLVLKEGQSSHAFAVGPFYVRRALKLFPPLLVVVVIPTIVYSFFNRVSWFDFAGEIFFYYNWIKVDGGGLVLPGTGVVWSLSIEEQFYLVFAIAWLTFVRFRHAQLLLGALSVSVVVYSFSTRFLLAASGAPESRIYYGSDTRADAIALGVLLAIFVFRVQSGQGRAFANSCARWMARPAFLYACVGLYIASLLIRDEFFRDTFRFSWQSIAACGVIAYGFFAGKYLAGAHTSRVFYSVARLRLVNAIGLASYSIYLSHLVVAIAIGKVLEGCPSPLIFAASVIGGVASGFLIYFLVEVPVQNWRQRRAQIKVEASRTSSVQNEISADLDR